MTATITHTGPNYWTQPKLTDWQRERRDGVRIEPMPRKKWWDRKGPSA